MAACKHVSVIRTQHIPALKITLFQLVSSQGWEAKEICGWCQQKEEELRMIRQSSIKGASHLPHKQGEFNWNPNQKIKIKKENYFEPKLKLKPKLTSLKKTKMQVAAAHLNLNLLRWTKPQTPHWYHRVRAYHDLDILSLKQSCLYCLLPILMPPPLPPSPLLSPNHTTHPLIVAACSNVD